MLLMFLFRSSRITLRIHIRFSRTNASNEIEFTEGGFTIPVFTVADAADFDIPMIVSILQAQIEHFNQRGSSWIVNDILRCYVNSVPYRPIEGSSYVKTPKTLSNKGCTINVKNKKLCFLYAILAQIYPVKRNPQRVKQYKKYLSTLKHAGTPVSNDDKASTKI